MIYTYPVLDKFQFTIQNGVYTDVNYSIRTEDIRDAEFIHKSGIKNFLKDVFIHGIDSHEYGGNRGYYNGITNTLKEILTNNKYVNFKKVLNEVVSDVLIGRNPSEIAVLQNIVDRGILIFNPEDVNSTTFPMLSFYKDNMSELLTLLKKDPFFKSLSTHIIIGNFSAECVVNADFDNLYEEQLEVVLPCIEKQTFIYDKNRAITINPSIKDLLMNNESESLKVVVARAFVKEVMTQVKTECLNEFSKISFSLVEKYFEKELPEVLEYVKNISKNSYFVEQLSHYYEPKDAFACLDENLLSEVSESLENLDISEVLCEVSESLENLDISEVLSLIGEYSTD